MYIYDLQIFPNIKIGINIIPLKKNKQKYVSEGIHFPLVVQELAKTFDVILLL